MITSANAYVQTTTRPAIRGRVMSLYLMIFMGGTPLGGPLLGLVANELGPRWAIVVGALAGLAAATVVGRVDARHTQSAHPPVRAAASAGTGRDARALRRRRVRPRDGDAGDRDRRGREPPNLGGEDSARTGASVVNQSECEVALVHRMRSESGARR